MKILLIFRDPSRGGKSVEEIFNGLYTSFHEQINIDRYYYQDHHSIWFNRRQILETGAQVFHITSDMYWLALILPNKMCILTIHDIGHYFGMSGIRKWIYKKVFLQWPGGRAVAITTVSNFTLESLKRIFPQRWIEKTFTIHNPTPLVFEKHSITPVPGNKIVLQVGTSPHKNCESVIKAMQSLPYNLYIIGPLSEAQRELLNLTGTRYKHSHDASYEDIFAAYLKADVVTFISLYEGFGMPIIEAQAAGRPVITCRNTSLPEVAGAAAHFIEQPHNIQEISQAIVKLMEDGEYRENLIQMGIKNIRRFNRDGILRAYMDVYRSTLAK